MKYESPANPNYVATVIEVKALNRLDRLDNLVSINAFGYQALVSKDTQVGDVGVIFTAESQLSEEFARENNLHRHTDRNRNPKESGYLEDSRRVKAIKLRGHNSNALFMPLSAFKYLKLKPEDFEVGDVFDKIAGHEIVKKYQLKEPGEHKGQTARIRKVDAKTFPVHLDTENYWRNSHKIPQEAQVVVTQKLHGTSARFGHVHIERDLTWKDRLAKWLGVEVSTHKVASVAGSRMVVKSIDGEAEDGKQHFYATDLWSEWAEKIKDVIPENWLVYGEIVGFTSGGQPIQKGYTYNVAAAESELYVYRVATINAQGVMVDLSWDAVREFAVTNDLKYVPELWRGPHSEFNPDDYVDNRFADQGIHKPYPYKEYAVVLSDAKTVDEGVVVRYDVSYSPYLLKAKSPIFLGWETAELDKGIIDTESEESS